MFELKLDMPEKPFVVVETTEGRGFTPDEVAERCVKKIISVSDSAHPGIRGATSPRALGRHACGSGHSDSPRLPNGKFWRRDSDALPAAYLQVDVTKAPSLTGKSCRIPGVSWFLPEPEHIRFSCPFVPRPGNSVCEGETIPTERRLS